MKQAIIQDYEILKDYKDVITPKELMEILKLNKNKVYKLLDNNTIPSKKIDSQYRILKQNVVKFLKNEL